MIGTKPEQFLTAWEDYVYHQSELTTIHPRIMKSWKRCRAYLNPFQHIQPAHLNEEILLATQVASFDLISVARPVLEEIFENIEHSGTAVVLTNSAGYVLDILSDPIGAELLHSLGIKQGVSLTEIQYGTNAFGLALIERMPARVVGAEHYLRHFHPIADLAAPVFDWNGSPPGAPGAQSKLPPPAAAPFDSDPAGILATPCYVAVFRLLPAIPAYSRQRPRPAK